MIPSFIAENCYMVLGNLTGQLLSADRLGQPATIQEVNAIYKLTLTINKLKAKATLNESMETLAWFTESVQSKDPELAQKLQPHLEEYIAARASKGTNQYWKSKLSAVEKNTINSEAQERENELDMEDLKAWAQPAPSFAGATPVKENTSKQQTVPSGPVHTAKPQTSSKSIRDMLRGTATTGPAKTMRQHQAAA